MFVNLVKVLVNRNKGNLDLFEKIRFYVMPIEVRKVFWKFFLVQKNIFNNKKENSNAAKEYLEEAKVYKSNTISKFDLQIAKDCEEFVVNIDFTFIIFFR